MGDLEVAILEKLQQEEKFFIQPELQRLLDNVNNLDKKQSTTMDKKTLDCSLNKLQQDGHCKCISFLLESRLLLIFGRKRAVEAILHPSVYDAEDLSDRVHDRLRLRVPVYRLSLWLRNAGRVYAFRIFL
ncbi:putative transcription factor Tfc3 [Helianthus debilis subsp. tardiflorus]